MNGRAARKKRESRYHHGELRRALLDAAAEVVEREGAGALSLRDLARRLGVSHAAPAHHFPDRAALVAELAREGFELHAAATRAAGRGARNPRDRLERIARAYVQFALEHTGLFRVMFGREVSDLDPVPAPLAEAGGRAFGVLAETVEAILAGLPAASRPPADAAAFACWSIVHGAATLWVDGPLRCQAPRAGARARFERGFSFALDLVGGALAPAPRR
jgi:AcrR family transcriptional regulator